MRFKVSNASFLLAVHCCLAPLEKQMKVFAKDVMQSEVKTVAADLPLTELVARFAGDDVRGFPVIDSDQLCGVVSTTDVFRAFDKLESLSVKDVMNKDVVSVSPSTTLHEAAAIMSDKGIHRVLVLDENKIVGVLSALDIVRACGNDRIDISFTPPPIRDF